MRAAITVVCAGCLAVFVAERLTGDGFLAVSHSEASRIAGGCNSLSTIHVTNDCAVNPNCTSQVTLCSVGSCLDCPNAQNPTLVNGLDKITTQNMACPAGTTQSCTGLPPTVPCSCTGMIQGNQGCGNYNKNIDSGQSCTG
jgi:hypothetical protein